MADTHHHRPEPLKRTAIAAYRSGLALVSGAARAQGLGYAFARQLAADGMNLVLVDILVDELLLRAEQLRTDFGVEVRSAACDLGDAAPYDAIEAVVGDIDVGVLVCNHTLTPTHTLRILDVPLETQSRMLDINARA